MKMLLSFICGFLLLGCSNQRPEVTGLEGKPIPSFNFLLLDSITKFNTNNIPTGKPTVIVYLSPTCPYCRVQTEEIIQDMKDFESIQLYILTNFPIELLRNYYKKYNLEKYQNIIVGYDFGSYFSNYFKIRSVPYIAIYNKDKLLKQVFIGKVESQLIKNTAVE
jgi:thiol-disulfide isomerase/thioredoxin